MIPELGHFALALAVALATAQAVIPLWGARARDPRLMAAAPALALGQLIALAVSYGALVRNNILLTRATAASPSCGATSGVPNSEPPVQPASRVFDDSVQPTYQLRTVISPSLPGRHQ